MSDLPIFFADIIPSGGVKPYDGKVAPVEKTTETGELPAADETSSETQVPAPAPTGPPTHSNPSLYIGVFAIAVAVVALFALFKRGAFAPKPADARSGGVRVAEQARDRTL